MSDGKNVVWQGGKADKSGLVCGVLTRDVVDLNLHYFNPAGTNCAYLLP